MPDLEKLNIDQLKDFDYRQVYEKKIPYETLPPIKEAGVNLVKLVLFIMIGFIILFLVCSMIEQYTQTDYIEKRLDAYCKKLLDDKNISNIKDKLEVVKEIQQEIQKEKREVQTALRVHWKGILQLVLINTLLPILTALLGYIFGTKHP